MRRISKNLVATGRRNEMDKIHGTQYSLYDSLLNCKSFNGFDLMEVINIHTFECTCRMPDYNFSVVYGLLRSYIKERSKSSPYYKRLLQKFPERYRDVVAKPITKPVSKPIKKYRLKRSIRFFPVVNVEYGIRLFLYCVGNVGTVKIIVDPVILSHAHREEFDPDSFDYMKLSERDTKFWLEVVKYVEKFAFDWYITGVHDQQLSLSRVDIAANIKVDSHYSIPTLLYYYKRSIKRKSYRNIHFRHRNQDKNMLECMNLSQRFTIYNKSYEQYWKHGKLYPCRVLRLEYKIYPKCLYTFKRQYRHEKHCERQLFIQEILQMLSRDAPFIMYEAIRKIFKNGDFYSEKVFTKLASKVCKRDSAINDTLILMHHLSKFTSYDNIMKSLSDFREVHGDSSTYRRLKFLKDLNVSPILLDSEDTSRYKKFPSVMSLFLSAIINGYNSGSSDELDYIRSFLPDLPDQ